MQKQMKNSPGMIWIRLLDKPFRPLFTHNWFSLSNKKLFVSAAAAAAAASSSANLNGRMKNLNWKNERQPREREK